MAGRAGEPRTRCAIGAMCLTRHATTNSSPLLPLSDAPSRAAFCDGHFLKESPLKPGPGFLELINIDAIRLRLFQSLGDNSKSSTQNCKGDVHYVLHNCRK